MSAMDAQKRIWVQIAINTGSAVGSVSAHSDLDVILAQIVANTGGGDLNQQNSRKHLLAQIAINVGGATYPNGDTVSPMDSISRLLVQIAFGTGGPLYENGNTVNAMDEDNYILVQIALNTEASGPTSLVFSTQPGSATIGEPFGQQPVVTVDDPTFTGDVTIAINTGTGVLSGTLTKAAVAGVATFTDLEIDSAGNFTLVASIASPALSVVSASFAVAYSAAVEAYADLLILNGGTDIRANGQAANFQNFVTSAAYIALGSPDFLALRSSQNVGTGTTAFSFLGVSCPIINAPTWGANGITFAAGTGDAIEFPVGVIAQPFTYFAVYRYTVIPVTGVNDIALGSSHANGGIIFGDPIQIFDGSAVAGATAADTSFHRWWRVGNSPAGSKLIQDGVQIVAPGNSGATGLDEPNIGLCDGFAARQASSQFAFYCPMATDKSANQAAVDAIYATTLGQGL